VRIVVHPHAMEIGGSQLNALELAQQMAGRGHEMIVYGPQGVLVEKVHEMGLEYVAAPRRIGAPSLPSAVALTKLVRSRRPDLVHAYEWNALLDTMYGPGWLLGTPVLSTVLSMDVPYFLPPGVPMVLGTRQLLDEESVVRDRTYLLEPPIDTELNSPGVDAEDARARWGIRADELLVVVVGRLSQDLKLEGILSAIVTIGVVAMELPARLLIVGDGPERGRIEQAAGAANAAAGREVVTVAGPLLDPRPVYAGADVVLGMGGSALRGMAFEKPLVVQGERGFWQTLRPSTLPLFLQQGWYGLGNGSDGAVALIPLLRELLSDPTLRRELGTLGRQVVVDHFSLKSATDTLEEIYRTEAGRRTAAPRRLSQAAATTLTLAKHHAARVRARAGARVGLGRDAG
jgi:glycosyltransferase involved in cell wall biosynthesis